MVTQHQMLAREARLAHAEKRFMACRMACQQLLKLRKNDPDALLMLAAADFGEGKSKDAILKMQKYVRLYPKDVDSRCYLATLLAEVGRHRESVVQYDKALRHAPHHPDAIAGKGRALDLSGEPGRAMKLLEPYLTESRATPAIARVYANCLMNQKDYERAIDLARPFAENHGGDVVSAAGLWFIIGQSLERLDRAEESFAAYTNANRVNAQPFDPVAFERRIDELMDIYSEANLAKLPRVEDRSDAPVFLACLPRSGSTLVERILSSHPAVHAAGELNTISRIAHEMQLAIGSTVEYPRCALDLEREDVNTLGLRYLDELRKLDRKAARFTNKDLFLWENLGLIELLLPGSRVIDIRRDKLDHSLACYFIDLGPKFPYAFQLEHIALVRRCCDRLMDHWQSVLSLPMMTVNYEDIVADQEACTRTMLDFLGLEWDDRVLEFHRAGESKKSSAIPTLSYAQVRQPIYTTSVGRAEKFRPFVGDLVAALEG